MPEELNLPVTVGALDPIIRVWTVSVQVRATQEFDNSDQPWTAMVFHHDVTTLFAVEGNGSAIHRLRLC